MPPGKTWVLTDHPLRVPSFAISSASGIAVTVDVYSTWDSIYNSDFAQMSALWRKVHPDMEFGSAFEQYDKLRRQGDINVYVVQDTIAKK